jgi:hypothetical protein
MQVFNQIFFPIFYCRQTFDCSKKKKKKTKFGYKPNMKIKKRIFKNVRGYLLRPFFLSMGFFSLEIWQILVNFFHEKYFL